MPHSICLLIIPYFAMSVGPSPCSGSRPVFQLTGSRERVRRRREEKGKEAATPPDLLGVFDVALGSREGTKKRKERGEGGGKERK